MIESLQAMETALNQIGVALLVALFAPVVITLVIALFQQRNR